MRAQVGDKAPAFTLSNQDGKTIESSSFYGKQPIVIYFYPKNFTPGCTAEACSFRDHYEDFTDLGAAVIGVSNDTVSSHARFVKKHNLPFTMLADENGELRKTFNVKGNLLGLIPGRETFVIDSDGIIQMRFDSMQASTHITKALKMLKALQDA